MAISITKAAAATVLAAGAASALAVSGPVGGGPLTFVGGTAPFSAPVGSGEFAHVWTFDITGMPAYAAASATNVSVFSFGFISDFAGTLDGTPLSYSVTPLGPTPVSGAAQVLAGGVGPLSVGTGYKLTISGKGPAEGASYGGSVQLSPIPEPGTYAMMLAGVAAVGFVVMRRRQRS
jgi:hypothetical protein